MRDDVREARDVSAVRVAVMAEGEGVGSPLSMEVKMALRLLLVLLQVVRLISPPRKHPMTVAYSWVCPAEDVEVLE